ncbi:MAG: hypothetical protein Q8P18_00750 [Pseudomonadota bacterium]|nr:hypothetical protein [Pseudomonadota bacterium]
MSPLRSRSGSVVLLHPELHPVEPLLSAQDLARLDLVELFRELDPASQRVLLGQLERTQARIRRYTPVAAIVRGERGRVTWRRGTEELWLTAPASRRFLRQQARG